MRRDIVRQLQQLLEAGQAYALATVTSTRGSVPGKLGFQLLVWSDGALGTVGGAGLEKNVESSCREALVTNKSRTEHYELSYKKADGLDSLCGGAVDVFIHVVKAKPHILLVGAGHIGHEVARLCDQLDYLYSVLDDRPEFNSAKRYPGAQQLHTLSADKLDGALDPSVFTHVLVAGYSHAQDLAVLSWLLPVFKGHVGLIGSAMRRKEFFSRLQKSGLDESVIQRIECPVGVPIGADTPAELAVSIMASFIRSATEGPASGPAPQA